MKTFCGYEIEKWKEIAKTFSFEQQDFLRNIYEACLKEGADYKTLYPLFALAFTRWRFSAEEWNKIVEEGQRIAEENGL